VVCGVVFFVVLREATACGFVPSSTYLFLLNRLVLPRVFLVSEVEWEYDMPYYCEMLRGALRCAITQSTRL
jgi:hypothetical protein